jgi:hypothetical protein
MKRRIISQTLFIGKSLLWSLLMYVIVMISVNWDELGNTSKKQENGQSWVKKSEEKELIPVKAGEQSEKGRVLAASIRLVGKTIRAVAEVIF